VGQQDHERVRPQRQPLGDFRRHPHDEFVDGGKALARGEALAPVHHHRAQPQHPRQLHERHRHVRGPEHDEREGWGVQLEVQAHRLPGGAHHRRPRTGTAKIRAACRDRRGIERRVAQRPLAPAGLEDDEAIVPPVEGRDDPRAPPRLHLAPCHPERASDRIGRLGGVDRLDQHLDRPAASHPQRPGVLVA